jgi:hypothetical protein
MLSRPLLLVTMLLYAAVLAAVIGGLFYARSAMQAAYGGAGEQAHWDQFRRDMRQRDAAREAQRVELARGTKEAIEPRPPKPRSARPPALELLENHFAACLAVSVVSASALFAAVWGLAVGAVLRPGRRIELDEGDEFERQKASSRSR